MAAFELIERRGDYAIGNTKERPLGKARTKRTFSAAMLGESISLLFCNILSHVCGFLLDQWGGLLTRRAKMEHYT